MKARIYLFAIAMLLAASCGDSDSKGPELLFVQTSESASFNANDARLELTGINPRTGWFTDRPYREAGQIPTEEFLTFWDEGENSFANDPPNADFTCTIDGEVVNYVVELETPFSVGVCGPNEVRTCTLSYGVTFVGSDAGEAVDDFRCDGAAHLFIDDKATFDRLAAALD
jgi:hypothetical protein